MLMIQSAPTTTTVGKFFRKGLPRYYKKGTVIVGIDPIPNGVYFIETGYVKVYSITDDGDEFLHVIYNHGEVFPLVWAYLGIQADLCYETMIDSLIWRISRDQFRSYIESNLESSNDMAKQMARQFHVYSDRLDNLEYKKSSERVAFRLLYLAARFGIRRGKDIVIDAPVTQENIASSINLARESVTRECTLLEHRNIIARQNHHIVIKNLKQLRAQLSEPTGLKDWGLTRASSEVITHR